MPVLLKEVRLTGRRPTRKQSAAKRGDLHLGGERSFLNATEYHAASPSILVSHSGIFDFDVTDVVELDADSSTRVGTMSTYKEFYRSELVRDFCPSLYRVVGSHGKRRRLVRGAISEKSLPLRAACAVDDLKGISIKMSSHRPGLEGSPVSQHRPQDVNPPTGKSD